MRRPIALTGGIAEGKSTVLAMLAEQGLVTCSADDLSRSIFSEEEVQEEISRLVSANPPISREFLRHQIGVDPTLRRKLNGIMHRRVLAAIPQNCQVLEIPLLIETCILNLFSSVWVVTCGRDEQLQRLSERLNSKKEAEEFIKTQLPTRAKMPFAHHIIRTNHPLSNVISQVQSLVSEEKW